MLLEVTADYPGSSKYDGTAANPCQAGSLQLHCKTMDHVGPVKFRYSIEWVDADHCEAETPKGKVVLNKFNNFGWEGPHPFFGLPPTHNRRDNPARVRIQVTAIPGGDPATTRTWQQEVHYFTKLCQCRAIDDYGPEWLEWKMWRQRGLTLGKFYQRIRCLADNQILGVDKVYYKIMVDKYPDVFRRDMWGAGLFTGTKPQLLAGIEEAAGILEKELAKPEPVKLEDITEVVDVSKEAVEKQLKADNAEIRRFEAGEAAAEREAMDTELLKEQVREIAAALAKVQQALASLS